jgi:hypothetical protein
MRLAMTKIAVRGGQRAAMRAALQLLFVLALAMLLAHSAVAQAVKRLILTDGSYQTATQWSREGDRVRYFSAERGQWEELPSSLVDWKATDAWNSQTASEEYKALKQVTGEEIARRKEEMLNTPQVAPKLDPSLRLPPDGGVFLLEKRDGKPVLRQVYPKQLEANNHEEANLLRRTLIPLASRLQTLELKGASARVRVKAGASIFVDIDNSEGPIAGSEFRIVRLERKSNTRVVAKNKIGLRGTKMEAQYLTTRAEKFSGDWWRLIPQQELTPGEYAVVIPADQELGEVWDFGVEK